MTMLVAVLLLSMGITEGDFSKHPKISSMLHLQIPCLKYDVVESNLKYMGEQLRLTAIAGNGESLVEMWSDLKEDNWTLVLRTLFDNEGCILATGKGVVEEMPSITINEKAGP